MTHQNLNDEAYEYSKRTNTETRQSNFIKQVRDNWVILCFIVALIVQWTNFNTRIANAEADISNLLSVVNQINEINVRIAVIQADINYIKKNVQ